MAVLFELYSVILCFAQMVRCGCRHIQHVWLNRGPTKKGPTMLNSSTTFSTMWGLFMACCNIYKFTWYIETRVIYDVACLYPARKIYIRAPTFLSNRT